MSLFITFEGIDSCGKDTNIFELMKAIKDDGNGFLDGDKYSNIWLTREPSNMTQEGRKIAALSRTDHVDGKLATELLIKDRIEHTKIIKEQLKHSYVISSRYDLSTLSFQMTQDIDFETIYEMHEYEKQKTIRPDLTIVFDLPVEVAFKRIVGRDSPREYFETIDFQTKLQKNLYFCIEELRKRQQRDIIIVDSNQSREDVAKEMIEKVALWFKEYKKEKLSSNN